MTHLLKRFTHTLDCMNYHTYFLVYLFLRKMGLGIFYLWLGQRMYREGEGQEGGGRVSQVEW